MSGDLAAHLAVALAAHRVRLGRDGIPEPDGLDAFYELAAALSRGQDRSILDVGRRSAHPDVDRKALSHKETATMLGCSVSTVRRMIRAGTLPTVRVGARGVRVPATAVDDLIGQRR